MDSRCQQTYNGRAGDGLRDRLDELTRSVLERRIVSLAQVSRGDLPVGRAKRRLDRPVLTVRRIRQCPLSTARQAVVGRKLKFAAVLLRPTPAIRATPSFGNGRPEAMGQCD